jgi:hypothetical protein
MWSAIGGLAGRVVKGVKHLAGVREKSMIHLQHGLEQFEQETGSLTSDFITVKVNKIKEAEREVAVLEKKIKRLEPNNGGGLYKNENAQKYEKLKGKIELSKNKYSATFIDLRNSIERVRDNKRNNNNQKWFNAWSRLYNTVNEIVIFLDAQNWASNSFNSNNYVEGENNENEEEAVAENNHGNNGGGEVESVQGSEGEGSVGHDPNEEEASLNAATLEAGFNANNQSQVSRNANLQAEQARLAVEVAEAQARNARNAKERAEANRKAKVAREAEEKALRNAAEAEAKERAARNAATLAEKARQNAEHNAFVAQFNEQIAERDAQNRAQQEEWARAEREAPLAQQAEANRLRERETIRLRREEEESKEREANAKRNAEEKRKREAKEAQEAKEARNVAEARARKVKAEENARRNAEERLMRNALKQNQNLRNTSKNLNRHLGKYFIGLRELRELKKEVKPTGFFSRFTNKIKRVFSRGNTQKKQLRMRNASERFSNMNTNYKALEKLNEDQIKNENVRNKLRLTKKVGKCALALSEIEKRNSEYNDKYYNNSPKTLRNKFQRGLEKVGRYFMSRGNRNVRTQRLQTRKEQVEEFKRQEHDYVSRCKLLEESAQRNSAEINRKLTTKFPN